MKRSTCASGKGKSAFVLDGVLGRQHQEGLLHLVGDAVDGHLPFLHRLQQCGLRLGRGPVDLVGQDDLGEDGTGAKLELLVLLIEDAHAGHVGRQHVGRELDAPKRAADAERQRARQHGLAHARHILDQQVPLTEHRQERHAHLGVLADDHAAHVFGHAPGNGLHDFHNCPFTI